MNRSVCHISTVHSAFDDRIFYKECVSLAKSEFQVFLVIPHAKNEVVNNVIIKALPQYKSRLRRILISPFNAFYIGLKTNAQIYHLHDPELLLIGILLRLMGRKVVYDMHELVYHQIIDKKWLGSLFIRKIIAKIYYLIEKLSVCLFTKIILAEDGYSNYVSKHYSKQIEKFEYIRNFSILRLIQRVPPHKKNTTQKVIIYAGGLTEIRGIKEVVQAVNQLKDVELWLLGLWESRSYQEICMKEDLNKVVNYFGLVKMEEVYSYMKVAEIGIANLYPLENYLTSLPVKAFEYMACQLPIIMSDFQFWKEVFHECAVFVNPKSPDEIAEKIRYLLENPEQSSKLAQKGFEIVYKKYSWERESQKLIELYKNISI